jgi:hypothetical protein
MNNFAVLQEKFTNFKKFIKEVAQSPKVQLMANYTDAQFLAFSCVLLKFKSEQKLNELVDKTCDELEIEAIHKDKITRYYICFCDYLDLINKEPEVIKKTEEIKMGIQKKSQVENVEVKEENSDDEVFLAE